MNNNYLFYAQVFLLLTLFYFGSLATITKNPFLAVIFTLGLLITLWAFYNMGSKSYSPFPEPKKNNKLVQAGPYKYIRHPMYTGLILISLCFFLSGLAFTAFIVFALFLYVTDEKASIEERFLTNLHEEYHGYISKTKKFIPFLY